MKKLLVLILALTMICSLFAGCGAAKPEETRVPAAAAPEATETPTEAELSGTVVIYSTQTDLDHEVFLEIFSAQHPNVEVEFINGSLGELAARVEAEKENPQADIIFGGLSQTDGDRYHHLLQQYIPKYDDQSCIPSDGYYTYFTLQHICLIKNVKLLEELGVDVNGYADLLQPELKGSIIQADPSASSSAWRQLQTMLYLMGEEFADDAAWKFQEDLIANCDGVITTSSSTCYKSVYNGEYAVGLSYDNGCISLLMSDAEGVEIVWPEEGNTACGFASAMIKDCPHPELAAAVLDVLSSAEFQMAREAAAGAKGTNTTYVYDKSYFPANLSDMLVEMDFAMLTEQKAGIVEKWTDMWASANG